MVDNYDPQKNQLNTAVETQCIASLRPTINDNNPIRKFYWDTTRNS